MNTSTPTDPTRHFLNAECRSQLREVHNLLIKAEVLHPGGSLLFSDGVRLLVEQLDVEREHGAALCKELFTLAERHIELRAASSIAAPPAGPVEVLHRLYRCLTLGDAEPPADTTALAIRLHDHDQALDGLELGRATRFEDLSDADRERWTHLAHLAWNLTVTARQARGGRSEAGELARLHRLIEAAPTTLKLDPDEDLEDTLARLLSNAEELSVLRALTEGAQEGGLDVDPDDLKSAISSALIAAASARESQEQLDAIEALVPVSFADEIFPQLTPSLSTRVSRTLAHRQKRIQAAEAIATEAREARAVSQALIAAQSEHIKSMQAERDRLLVRLAQTERELMRHQVAAERMGVVS